MNANNENTGHNRTILFTDLPKEHKDDLDQLEVFINYTGQGNASKGIALDKHIIPAILKGLKLMQES